MVPTTEDRSLFAKICSNELARVSESYVGDTLSAGNSTFEHESRSTERKFQSSARIYDNVIFAGIQVSKLGSGYLMNQTIYVSKIERIPR